MIAHAAWLKSGDGTDAKRAVLCRINLNSANLRGANLKKTDLSKANLVGADLSAANLEEADLSGANMKRAALRNTNLRAAVLVAADLGSANLIAAKLNETDMTGVDLNAANLLHAELDGANLTSANLEGAILREAKLTGANLREADPKRANLLFANLVQANLRNTKLIGADLRKANLQRAGLEASDLQSAGFREADLRGANFQYSTIAGAKFDAAKVRDASFLGVELRYLQIFESLGVDDFPEGLVSVRERFKKAGYRNEERYFTFLIKRNERRKATVIEGTFSYILFELTSDWGYAPGRPLRILGLLILAFSLVYLYPIWQRPDVSSWSGIYQIWPEGRLEKPESKDEQIAIAKEAKGNRFCGASYYHTLWYAFYFSLLSAFNIGWRELNVGNWIVRLQLREYSLRPRGWVRVISSAQSLLSVYLMALWVLVYFGRPFE